MIGPGTRRELQTLTLEPVEAQSAALEAGGFDSSKLIAILQERGLLDTPHLLSSLQARPGVQTMSAAFHPNGAATYRIRVGAPDGP